YAKRGCSIFKFNYATKPIASPDNGADHHIYVLQELFGKFSDEFIQNIHNAKDEHQILNILINS
ncbi:hypothetical protein ACED53_22630, partial [Vibrio sp. 1F169]